MIRTLTMDAQMVASAGHDPHGPFGAQRINSSLVSPWPNPIDMQHDIIAPGKVDTYRAELIAALSSRGLYTTILEVPPTLESIAEDNPEADPRDIASAYENIMNLRRHDNAIIAATYRAR